VLGDDFVDDRSTSRSRCGNDVGLILALHAWFVASRRRSARRCRETRALPSSGTGHPGELLVEAEVVLERDRGERLVLAANDRPSFPQWLMDALGIAASVHQATGELIDDDDFAVLDMYC